MRVLLLEDDQAVATWAARTLGEAGHEVDVVAYASEARERALAELYDVLLLDLRVPDGNGYDVLVAVRDAGRTVPIIIMTGAGDDEEIIRHLDAGANEYIVKPITGGVLRARVDAVVRATNGSAGSSETLKAGSLVFNRLQRTVTVRGRAVTLTPKEFSLLETLLLRGGEPISRTELLSHVWGVTFDPGTNVVDATVSRLRHKLTESGASTSIRSVRGVGFALTAEE